MKIKKNNKGITLIALIITIIILLILAGISIQELSKSNLFKNAQKAKNNTIDAQNLENTILSSYEEEINKYTSNSKDNQIIDISKFKYTKNENELTLTISGFSEENSVENLVIEPKYIIDGKEYTVTKLEGMAFIDNTTLKSVYIPETVTDFGDSNGWKPFLRCWNLEAVTINENNKNYKSVDGIVYTKDMKNLVLYPGGCKKNIYTIPEGVEKLEYSALYFDGGSNKNEMVNSYINEIIIPNSLNDIYLRGWNQKYINLVVKWNGNTYDNVDTFNTDWSNSGKSGSATDW